MSIEGLVLHANSGAPVSNATVGTSLDATAAVTDEAGHFLLRTATPADYCCTPYTITITAPGYQSFAGTWRWGDHPDNQVFRLVPGYAGPDPQAVSIEGRVFDAVSSLPLGDAVIGTSLDSAVTHSDAAGHFLLQTATPALYCCTAYTITIKAVGYRDFEGTWIWGDHPIAQTFGLMPL